MIVEQAVGFHRIPGHLSNTNPGRFFWVTVISNMIDRVFSTLSSCVTFMEDRSLIIWQ